MFVEDKPVITNPPSKHPVVNIKQQKEGLGGEANILFHTQYFSYVNLVGVFFSFSWFRSKELKMLSRQFPPELSEDSLPNASAKQSCVIKVLSDLFYSAQFQINRKNDSNKFVYGFMRQHVYARS